MQDSYQDQKTDAGVLAREGCVRVAVYSAGALLASLAMSPKTVKSCPLTSTGTVTITGEMESAWLMSGGQRFAVGPVPEGRCALIVRFSQHTEPTLALDGLALSAGETISVKCFKGFTQCKRL